MPGTIEEIQKVSKTDAADTSQVGSSSLSGPTTFELGAKSPEVHAELIATPETPEAAVDRLTKEKDVAALRLTTFDQKAKESGKSLENSEFLDRTSLMGTAMSLQMLSLQKKLEMFASKGSLDAAGTEEFTKLKQERSAMINEYAGVLDKAMEESTGRALAALSQENKDLAVPTAIEVLGGYIKQLALRRSLEAAAMLDFDGVSTDAQQIIAEVLREEPAASAPKAPEKNTGFSFIALLEKIETSRVVSAAPTEAAPSPAPEAQKNTQETITDTLSKVAILEFSVDLARIAAEKSDPESQQRLGQVVKNLELLSGVATTEAQNEAQKTLREMFLNGTSQPVDSKSGIDAALATFTAQMEAAKKGKAEGGFMNKLKAIGAVSFLGKLASGAFSMLKRVGAGVELAAKGSAFVEERIEGLLEAAFNKKVDLSKEISDVPATEPTESFSTLTPSQKIDQLEKQDGSKPIELNEAEREELMRRVAAMGSADKMQTPPTA